MTVTLLAYVDEVQLFDRRGLLIITALVVVALLPLWLRDRRKARRRMPTGTIHLRQHDGSTIHTRRPKDHRP